MKNKPQRLDEEFEKQMRQIAKIRVEKGLAKMNPKDISMREITHLTTRTAGWPGILEELKNKAKGGRR